ncbi:unnamed protein product [Mytilus coruscus]|uniref:Peptidase A2 domain-containing protein n=1 Tax=Mytilus coruscus TaxID=42192 RepID=A0A6J8C6F3_MYTCO|nr:unnamed protein product [Mytilus coruscus]
MSVVPAGGAYSERLHKVLFGKPTEPGRQARSSGIDSESAFIDFSSQKKHQFLYINVFFDQLKVAALVESGSSVNIMSKSLFDSVSDKQKLSFEQLDCSEIRLANNDTIKGLQGVCSKGKFSCSKGLLVAKSVVTVPYNRKVPVKLLNPTSENVVIPKGRTIAEFSVLNKEYECASFSDTIPEVQHVEVSETVDSLHSQFTSSKPDYSKVKSLFTLPENLQETELDKLACLLHDNLDLFVTEDNPNLGFTRVVEHKILLKPDAVGKHQKPYRLLPYKREILREHLDNLLKQGIIAPVSEKEDLLITSPIVLVTKRSKSSAKPCAQDFRFCCDFRFLN